MHILIVSATQFEVKPLLDLLKIEQPVMGINAAGRQINGHNVQVLITGVGMVNTAFMMGRHITVQYDLIINAGVCGAFNRDLQLGQLVNVTQDVLSELGAEDGDDFLTYDQMGLPGEHMFSYHFQHLPTAIDSLKKVKGITVNTVHGNDASIKKIRQLYNADVESMEGAAFFSSCYNGSHHYVQIRAISNYVEKRDKSKCRWLLAILTVICLN
jgi:futalosine hydrolase